MGYAYNNMYCKALYSIDIEADKNFCTKCVQRAYQAGHKTCTVYSDLSCAIVWSSSRIAEIYFNIFPGEIAKFFLSLLSSTLVVR